MDIHICNAARSVLVAPSGETRHACGSKQNVGSPNNRYCRVLQKRDSSFPARSIKFWDGEKCGTPGLQADLFVPTAVLEVCWAVLPRMWALNEPIAGSPR